MSNAICDLVLYLHCEGLNISMNILWCNSILVLKKSICNTDSTLSLVGSQFIFLKCNGLIWDLRGKFRQKQIRLFRAFWSLSFRFFSKSGNHKENLWSKWGWISTLHNSLLYPEVRYQLFWYRNFSLAFIFFRTFEAIASLFNWASSWQPGYCTVSCCLMEWNGPQRIY